VKFAARIALLLVALLLMFLAFDALRSTSAPRRAEAVRVGDTKKQVRSVMGLPSEVTCAGIFDKSETWVYGGIMDWNHLMSRPFRFRLFGPNRDEVAIQFDGDGSVKRVIIPGPGEK
jgi:outer membrane protein assembly factor BamE (lipoprotein component of BamABCDE complex)